MQGCRLAVAVAPTGCATLRTDGLAEAGCTPHEIAAITGHASLKEVIRYTEAADRKHLAAAAMDKVKARTLIGKPVVKFAKKAKKAL